jgi:Major Facilitator Superfamily
MLDLRLFRVPAFAGASIASFAAAASVFSMLLYIVLYLQNVLGHSPLEAGLRLLPITAMAFAFSPLAAKLSERAPLRALIGAGLALAGVGLLVAGGLNADSEWTALLSGLLLMGAGIGLVNPSVAEAAIGVVPAAKAATGAAINNTFRQVGVAVGIAALGAVFQGRIESKLGDLLTSGPPALQGQAGALTPAVSSGNAEAAIAAAPPEAQAFLADAAREAFLSGLNLIFVIAGVTALVGAALSLALIRSRDLQLDSREESAITPDPAVLDEQPALAE